MSADSEKDTLSVLLGVFIKKYDNLFYYFYLKWDVSL